MSPDLARRLAALRSCAEAPAAFWSAFLGVLTEAAGAGSAHLYRLAPPPDDPAAPALWRRLAAQPARGAAPGGALEACAAAPVTPGAELVALPGPQWAFVLRLHTGEDGAAPVVLLPLGERSRAEAEAALPFLLLAADTPALYLRHHRQTGAHRETEVFAGALDLLALLNRETRFAAAALLVCDELSHRLHADRVSLGWLESGDLVKVRALSGADKFDRRTEALRALELALEECLDQDAALVFPAPDGAETIGRDHAAYAALAGAGGLLSVPLRIDGRAVAVLLAERAAPFGEDEIATLRVHADQVARRLSDLRGHDRPWPMRAAARVRRWAATWAGPRHTTAKLVAVVGALLLLILVFGQWPYRVKAPFVLRSDQVVYVTAPFDGYLAEAPASPGDVVGPTDVLARFDTRELLLEESAALADQTRYLREAERARARDELAELRIAEAQSAQSAARLEQVRHRLARAALTAGFAATVAEGDQRRRLGAPVRAGDVLYQVARLDTLSVEAQVDERDIHEIVVGARVTVAFESRPSETFALVVERIEPSARPTAQGNVFHVRCRIEGAPADWWRPGMGGVAIIRVGWRGLLWIFTHRTADYLRLHWWFW